MQARHGPDPSDMTASRVNVIEEAAGNPPPLSVYPRPGADDVRLIARVRQVDSTTRKRLRR